MKVKLTTETIREVIALIREGQIDIVFFHLYECNEDEVVLIKELKNQGIRITMKERTILFI